MKTKVKICSQNILFRLGPKKWNHDLNISKQHSDLRALQEVAPLKAKATVRAHCIRNRWGSFGLRTSVPILHAKKVWKPLKKRGVVRVHGRAKFMPLNPARFIVYRGYKHKETGYRIMVINVHPTSGYAKPLPNKWGRRANAWKDHTARMYWFKVRDLIEIFERSRNWDAIVVLGDFNARLANRQKPYYPGVVLRHYCRVRAEIAFSPNSIDAICETQKSRLYRVRRWKQSDGIFSDHPIQFAVFNSID